MATDATLLPRIQSALLIETTAGVSVRCRFVLLLFFAALSSSGFCAEPLEVTWRINRKAPKESFIQFDTLVLNGMKMPTEGFANLHRLGLALKAAGVRPGRQRVRVTIPSSWDSDPISLSFMEQGRILQPSLPIDMSLIFTSLTSPEKQVTYFQSGKKLRRYIIRCSSKGTANNPEDANYWLDGEPLGNWSKARDRFMQLKWEKNAVVDVLFDCPNIWTSSGGLYLLPEFGELSRKHGLFLNQHRTHRAEDDD